MVTFFLVKCAVSVAALLVSAAAFFYFGKYLFTFENKTQYVDVDSKNLKCEIDDKFLSVALDVSFMRCYFHKFRERDWIRLENLSKLLAPAYLRFGGNDADNVIFDPHSTTKVIIPDNVSCENFPIGTDKLIITGGLASNSCEVFYLHKPVSGSLPATGSYRKRFRQFVVSEMSDLLATLTVKAGEEWSIINEFAEQSGLSLITDLNVLLRRGSEWDSSNAKDLIEFSNDRNYPMDFQLGNEPNAFKHKFNITLTGKQLARDFNELKEILQDFTKNYRESKVIGPDVTRPKNLGIAPEKFLDQFLEYADVDVVSWHQYYLNGRTATLEDFITPKTFDILPSQIETITEVVRKHSQTMPIWLSETSTAYGGGAPNLSDRFVASLLWVDKLGIAARMNMSVVIRQSLFKEHYALISNELDPNPDYWISIFYKVIVGKEVLSAKLSNEDKNGILRFYCHCLAPNVDLKGTLVIYGVNLSNNTEFLIPSGITVLYPIYAFIFQPGLNDLKSKDVLLNGKKLEFNDTINEDMVKMAEEVKLPLSIPPYSIVFWVVNENSQNRCDS